MSDEDPRMRADECAGNAAPFVLGALDERELVEFRAHLETCAVCREEVAALQVVSDALPALAPPLEAPPGLKDRVMASLRADAGPDQGRTAAPAGTAPSAPRLQRRRPRLAAPRVGLALAGLAAVLAAVAVAVFAGGGSSERVIRAQVLAPNGSATVHVRGGRAELEVSGLPQPAGNRVYEVWVKRAGAAQPTDALFTLARGGRATVAVPGGVAGVKVLMVTAEPRGGSRAPTSAPVIVATIS